MNTVICQINSKYIHSSLAAWCIKAGVERYSTCNTDICVVEGTINEDINAVAQRIFTEKPDILGFCCYIWNITFVRTLAEAIKKRIPQCRIVFGGPEVSYNAEEILRENRFVDFVISGEGEYPFAYLTDCIVKNLNPNGYGICYREDFNDIVVSEPHISCEEPPTPYCNDYFEALGGRIAYIETSRGCPYSCAFCLSGRCGGVRYFDIDRIFGELKVLAQSGCKTIKFVDRTFNAHKARAKKIVSFITDNYGEGIPKEVCFHFEIAGDILDDELITLLTSAPKGLFQLEIGMQSFNETTLESINRKTNCEKLKKNIEKLISARNMHIHIDLIAGLPFEDFASFEESFNTAYSLGADMLQLGFLKLLHGAEMRESPEKYPCEFDSKPPYEVNCTPYINGEQLQKLKKIEDTLERTYNSGRFRYTLEYVISTGFEPFELFEKLSEVLSNTDRISLNDYTSLLFDALKDFEGVNCEILRDKMLCDRLSVNRDGKIPPCLRIEDPFLKTARHFLGKQLKTEKSSGVKRAVALLYSEKKVVWCDYNECDPITGRYPLNKLDFDSISKLSD